MDYHVHQAMRREQREKDFQRGLRDPIKSAIDKAKGDVCREFEKVCPGEMSFNRMKKDMHDIFDRLEAEIKRARA